MGRVCRNRLGRWASCDSTGRAGSGRMDRMA